MPGPLAYRAYAFLWQSLDWFYPPTCAGCGRTGKIWCDECIHTVSQLGATICPVCGTPQKDDKTCPKCLQEKPPYQALRSWAYFGGRLRKAIHKLKYQRNVALGYTLAEPMIGQLFALDWIVDVVVPVPLGLARLAERGYNQASLLAKPIALYFQWKYQPDVIVRHKETHSQVGLPLRSRKENVAGAFVAKRSLAENKRILIIDDVITSGSTMEACALALREAGAEKIYGLSLARAGLKNVLGDSENDDM